MRIENKYCTVKHSSGDIHINDYIENARIETLQTINTYDNIDNIPVSDIPDMPEIGEQVEKDKLYNLNGTIYQCVQSHNRTIYVPEQTPDLWAVHRDDTGSLVWVRNEKVDTGDIRIYNDVEYECIQGHMTLESWTPDSTPALWQEVSQGGDVEEWVQPTGGHDAYNTGDRVLYNGSIYESTIDANVWSPDVYPAGWTLIE